MVPIIGMAVVLGCIAGGYLMEKGNLMVLMQPSELIIIGGAAIGTVLIGNPIYVLKSILSGILQVLKGSHYTANVYLDTLRFLNDFFSTARKSGLERCPVRRYYWLGAELQRNLLVKLIVRVSR